MAYTLPTEWLPYLAKELDAQVRENARLRAFYNGTQPGPEMSRKAKSTWIRFQRMARVHYARLIIESLAARITPTAVVISGDNTDEAQDVARKVWRRSRLDVVLADAIEDTLTVGRGFLLAAVDSVGRTLITFEDADRVFAVADPLDPTTLRAAVKVWRDDVAGRDYARVWTVDSRQDFSRTSTRTNSKALRLTASGGWEELSDPVPSDGVPLTMLVNRGAAGEFAHLTDLLDRISTTILNELVIIAYQAFKLRYFKNMGLDPSNPDDVKKGEELLEAAPGAVWDLGEGDLNELSSTDFRPVLDAAKEYVRELAAVSTTPVSTFIPEAANQSAEGSLAAREGQVLKSQDRIKRFRPPVEGIVLKAVRMELGASFDEDVEVTFANAALSTPNERTNAALQARAVGIPFRTVAVDYLGHTPEQADAMQTQREAESLALSIATPTPAAAPVAA